jgi:hypothetical protein
LVFAETLEQDVNARDIPANRRISPEFEIKLTSNLSPIILKGGREKYQYAGKDANRAGSGVVLETKGIRRT